jgi:hypothetical protein
MNSSVTLNVNMRDKYSPSKVSGGRTSNISVQISEGHNSSNKKEAKKVRLKKSFIV